jgi:hypothetical protein
MAVTSAASSQIVPPTLENFSGLNLENFFGLNIGNEYVSKENGLGIYTKWANPHLQQDSFFETPTLSAISPYIPGESLQFAFTAPSEFWHQDTTVVILSNLDLKTLVNCSTVCKFFYSASKADFIWRNQLWNLLPNVTNVPPNLCIFTPEQQYKVIFKRIQNECKPYIAKFNRNEELGNNWLNELKTLELQCQEAGGEAAAARYIDLLSQGNVENSENCPDYPASELNAKIAVLRYTLSRMFGANYNGTIESIDPNSVQGQILNAINILVPNAFNNQEKFESVIDKSVTVYNTSSSNSDGPIIEDVTDVGEPSEMNG